MKKLLLLFSIFVSVNLLAQHGTINIQTNLDSTTILQYGIDTLESYQVGPGIIYTRFDITNSSSTRHCYIYEVDLTNPYNTVEESHSVTMAIPNEWQMHMCVWILPITAQLVRSTATSGLYLRKMMENTII